MNGLIYPINVFYRFRIGVEIFRAISAQLSTIYFPMIKQLGALILRHPLPLGIENATRLKWAKLAVTPGALYE